MTNLRRQVGVYIPRLSDLTLSRVAALRTLMRLAAKSRSSINYFLHWLLYHLLARHLPASFAPGGVVWEKIRYWVCRPLFAYCGQNVNVDHGATFGRHTVSIGTNSSIGMNASVGSGTIIASNVMMGPEVLIYTQNHITSRVDIPMVQQGFTECAPVRIGDDVWIGARVIILPGVTIGSGSVLGAGAVISRDVPPYAVVVGNPGRVVRYRRGHSEPTTQYSKQQ
jgi:maltose O-acetyltransferase